MLLMSLYEYVQAEQQQKQEHLSQHTQACSDWRYQEPA